MKNEKLRIGKGGAEANGVLRRRCLGRLSIVVACRPVRSREGSAGCRASLHAERFDVADVGSPQPPSGGGLQLARRLDAASARLRAARKCARQRGGPQLTSAYAPQASIRTVRALARRAAASPRRPAARVRSCVPSQAAARKTRVKQGPFAAARFRHVCTHCGLRPYRSASAVPLFDASHSARVRREKCSVRRSPSSVGLSYSMWW